MARELEDARVGGGLEQAAVYMNRVHDWVIYRLGSFDKKRRWLRIDGAKEFIRIPSDG